MLRFGSGESEFYKAKIFNDHLRSIKLPNYYTVVNKNINKAKPWKYIVTSGVKFSSKGKISDSPIIFCRFSNAEGNELVRSPISATSILEASAMAQEILYKYSLISSLNINDRIIEGEKYSNEILDYIYSPSLTEYSVCAHLIANMQESEDIFLAYRLCFYLTRKVLNFPESGYKRIIHKGFISKVFNSKPNAEYIKYLENGIKYKDVGTLYYILCYILPKREYTSDQEIINSINSSIKLLGIDNKWLEDESDEEVKSLSRYLNNTNVEEIKQIKSAGESNYKKMKSNKFMFPFQELNLPPVLLSDCTSITIFKTNNNILKDLDIDNMYTELVNGQIWVENFSEACL